jgi:hypothetical protein
MIFIPRSIEECIILYPFNATLVPSDSCTPTKSNLYFPTSLVTILNEPDLYRHLTFHVPNLMSIFRCLGCAKWSVLFWGCAQWFVTNIEFYGEGGPPTVGCPRLLVQYIRSYPPYLETVSSICNPRTRHAMVTVDPLNMVHTYINIHYIHGSIS